MAEELARGRRYAAFAGQHDRRGQAANLSDWSFPGVDLSGEWLTDGSLMECDLTGARLDHAHADGALAGGVILARASLVGADFYKSILESADLSDAVATDARFYKANMRRAQLDRARLDGAYLFGVRLGEASLVDADLRGSDLARASLINADLTRARLDGARLDGVQLSSGTSLAGVSGLASVRAAGVWFDQQRVEGDDVLPTLLRLAGADAEGVESRGPQLAPPNPSRPVPPELALRLSERGRLWPPQPPDRRIVSLHGGLFPGVDLTYAVLRRSGLESADLSGAILAEVDAVDARAAGLVVSGGSVARANFAGASLVEADLRGVYGEAARFDRADLHWARLQGARLDDASFIGASCRAASFAGADLRGADLAGADLRDADLSSAQLDGARLQGCRVSMGTHLQRALGLPSVRADTLVLAGEAVEGIAALLRLAAPL